jgi:DNA-binding transcriptional LysR family regulator
LLDDLDDAEREASSAIAAPRGTLRVAAPPSFGLLHIAPALAAFLAEHPDVEASLILSDHDIDLAAEGLDVALRLGSLRDSGLVAHTFSHARTLVCGAPSYFTKHGRPRRPGDLIRHNCLHWRYTPVHYDGWSFKSGDEAIQVAVKGNLESNVADVLRVAAKEGLGLILQPAYMVSDDLKSGALEAVLTEYDTPAIGIHVVYLHRRHLPAKVRTFIDFLKQRFGDRTYLND